MRKITDFISSYVAGRVFLAIIADLRDGHLSLRAMGLVYTTLITLVPLLALSFSVLKGLGAHSVLEPFLANMFEGLGPEKSGEVAGKIVGFVDNVQVGVLGTVGLGVLFYMVVALMHKVETTMNYIWRSEKTESLGRRFSDYLTVLLVGPLMIFLSAGATTAIRHSPLMLTIDNVTGIATLFDFAAVFVPWLLLSVGLTFIYVFLPNARVKLRPALAGAVVAATIWKIMGFIFSHLIASSAAYVAIYAAFATLIVAMIWIYLGWLVVLIGADIAFYVQNTGFAGISRDGVNLSPRARQIIGLAVLQAIGRAHYKQTQPPRLIDLARDLKQSPPAIDDVLARLIDARLVAATASEDVRFIPGRPFEMTPLSAALEALEDGASDMRQSDKIADAQNVIDGLRRERERGLAAQSLLQTLVASADR